MLLKKIVLKLIRFYQQVPIVSYLTGGFSCRHQPTCSQFTYQAIAKYGIFRGSWQGIRRFICCHPWSRDHLRS